MLMLIQYLVYFGLFKIQSILGLPLPNRVHHKYSLSARSNSSTGTEKFVFAHHIIGNTFNFTSDTWASDVALAHASGIDGFALNIGNQPWEPDQVRSAYDAAQNSSTGFKMFLSLDMSSLPCTSPSDAQNIVSLVRSQTSHDAQFRYGPDNRAFVSTFAGEKCTFSASSPSEGWAQHFVAPLASEIYFVPAFFVDPAEFSTGDAQGKGGFAQVIDGDFNWNSGWPIQLTTATLTQSATNPSALTSLLNLNTSTQGNVLSNFTSPSLNASGSSILPSIIGRASSSSLSLTGLASAFKSPGNITDTIRNAFAQVAGAFTSDEQHLGAIQNDNESATGVANVAGANINGLPLPRKTYMAAVSPWFFTHFPVQTFNKNFIFLSDNHLYSKRWETLAATRDAVDLVEIATWNDFGESHYIGPIEGTQPNSQAWVNGNDHTGWLEITAYYAQAFKTGNYPVIEKDKVVMWARTHPRDAEASRDTVGKPTNFQLTEDSLWATVFLSAPANVTLSTAPNSNATALGHASPATQTFEVPAGASHLKVPLTPGGGMRAIVSRSTNITLDFEPEGYFFDPNPETFNFNAFVAVSP